MHQTPTRLSPLRPFAGAFLLTALLGACVHGGPPAPDAPAVRTKGAQPAAPTLVRGNTEFALALYRELGATSGDLFFSPQNISTAMAMTVLGATGQTRGEIAAALRFPFADHRLHEGFGELTGDTVEEERDLVFLQANRLWLQGGFDFRAEFQQSAATHYRAEAGLLDFQRKPEDSRAAINHWVAEKTRRKIEELIPKGVVTPDTRLVLTAAAYFKAIWQNPFAKEATQDAPFHAEDGSISTVAMMHQKENFPYGEKDDTQILSMPYAGGKFDMIVLLPKRGAFGEFERSLDADWLEAALKSLALHRVVLRFPKFEQRTSALLKEHFQRLGMKLPFTKNADFSGFSTQAPLQIADIAHEAFVSVDEKGSEAAAATAVIMRLTSLRPRPPTEVVFTADRPFIYLIRDRRHGGIVFMGRRER